MHFRLSLLSLLFSTKLFSQTYTPDSAINDIPVNTETKKVSISKIVDAPGVKADEVYSRVMDWYTLTKNSLKDIITTRKNDKKGKPQLVFIHYLNSDPNNNDSLSKNRHKLLFSTKMNQLKEGIMFAKWMSGMEYATLIILIKDDKFKIEFTNFSHFVLGDNSNFRSGYTGRKIDYEATDTFGQHNWDILRLESLNKHLKIMNEIIAYIKKPSNTDFNF